MVAIQRVRQHRGVITQKQSNTENNLHSNSNNGTNQNESTQGSNILIAYFTVPETDGVDTVASASRVVTADGVLGNTEKSWWSSFCY